MTDASDTTSDDCSRELEQVTVADGEAVYKDAEAAGFEGPEKTIEIDYVAGVGHPNGLREITKEQWDTLLDHAKCKILGYTGNR